MPDRSSDPYLRFVELNKPFFMALFNEDDLGCVVRGQTLVDHTLRQLIAAHFAPDVDGDKVVNWRYVGFTLRLELATALGELPKELLPPIRALNEMRNDFAHGFNATLSDSRTLDFVNTFPRKVPRFVRVIGAGIAKSMGAPPVKGELRAGIIMLRFLMLPLALHNLIPEERRKRFHELLDSFDRSSAKMPKNVRLPRRSKAVRR